MAGEITQDQLIGAGLDAVSLDDVTNQAPTFNGDGYVVTRRGRRIKTLSKAVGDLEESATASAAQALQSKISAANSAALAESAAGPTYATTAAGLAATINGQNFAVGNGDGTVSIYRNDSGTASFQRQLATTAALKDKGGASLVGVDDGQNGTILSNAQDLVNFVLAANTFLKSSGGAALVGINDRQNGDFLKSAQDLVDAVLPTLTGVALSDMPQVAPNVGKTVYLIDSVRNGYFECLAGSPPVSDPLQGRYIVSATNGFYWRRIDNGIVGYPEKFGAVAGGPDCWAAITACKSVYPACHLGKVDYYVSQTVKVRSFQTFKGSGHDYNGAANQATRILGIGATVNPLQIGPDSAPATINDFDRGIYVSDVWVARNVAPDIDAATPSIVHRWTKGAFVERVTAAESISCWHIAGVVSAHHNWPEAFRSTPGVSSQGTPDKWIGFDLDYTLDIGAAGGNASLYLNWPHSNFGGSPPANSSGIYAHGAFTDTFIFKPETTAGAVGIRVVGVGATGTNPAKQVDFKITEPVCDQHTAAPIYVSDVSLGGKVTIITPYCAPVTGATAGLYATTDGGVVQVVGGEMVMIAASGVPGVVADGAPGFELLDTTIIECSSTDGAVIINNSDRTKATPRISNANLSVAAAIKVTGSSACKIAPEIAGSAGKIAIGVNIPDNVSGRNEINVTGLDSTLIPVAKKLQIGSAGTSVTNTGISTAGSGTNLVSGVTA